MQYRIEWSYVAPHARKRYHNGRMYNVVRVLRTDEFGGVSMTECVKSGFHRQETAIEYANKLDDCTSLQLIDGRQVCDYIVGDTVELYSRFGGHDSHTCNGVVERLTATLVIVRNEHGNVSRFHRETGKMVGYSFPHLVGRVRRV